MQKRSLKISFFKLLITHHDDLINTQNTQKKLLFFCKECIFYTCIYIYTATCHGQDNICSRMISMRRDQCIVMLFSSVVCVCDPYWHKRKIQTGNKYWMKRNACVIVSHASNVILRTLKIVYSCVLCIMVQPYCLSA